MKIGGTEINDVKIGNTSVTKLFKNGSQFWESWSNYWSSRFPYFGLPTTGVSLMVGVEVTIYGDSLITIPVANPFSVTYTCDIGTQSGNNLVINPSVSDIGDHSLRMVFKNGNYTIEDQTITLTVYAKSIATSKKIMIIGDSTTGSGTICPQINSVLDNLTLTYLGTVGTTYLSEGYGGATWYGFLIGTHGKFFKSPALNVPAYFTDYTIDVPDYIYIRLGINDTFTHSNPTGDGLTTSEITGIFNNAKTLINALLAIDPNIKIILGIPTICENTGAGFLANYPYENFDQMNLYIQNIHKYWISFINEFKAGAYNARVDCSYEAIFLDRNDGYPKVDGVHSNGVHPTTLGYEQLVTGIAIAINKSLKTDLAPTGLATAVNYTTVSLTWTDHTGGVASYEIYRSNDNITYSLINTTSVGAVSYDDTLVAGDVIYYKIRAISGSWNSDYTSTSFSLLAISAPSGLALTLISGGIRVDWTDNTSGVAQTEVWAKIDSGEYALVSTVNAGLITLNDLRTAELLVTYKLRSKIGTSYSEYTAESSITMLGAEMVDQVAWSEASHTYWNTFGTGWSADGSKLTCDGSTSYIGRNAFWVVGKSYKVISSCVVNSGWYRVYNLSNYTGASVCSVTGTFTAIYTVSIGAVNMGIYSWAFNGNITSLSIREVLVP